MLLKLSPPEYEDHGTYKVRLADDTRKIIAYLGVSQQNGFHPIGTGFFLVYGEPSTCYLVTAAHVAKQLGNDHFVIRLNEHSGKGREIEIDKPVWHKHDDQTVDIAILEFNPPTWADSKSWPGHAIASEFKLQTKNLGAGDLVNIIGTYRLLHGTDKNIPIVHTGHIAMMPEDEPIPAKNWNAPDPDNAKLIHINGYLIEVSTLPAISGAPVLARRSLELGLGMVDPPDPENVDVIKSWVYGSAWLLGVWHGAWMGNPTDLLKELMLAEVGDYDPSVPLNMGIVTPAIKLIEILDSDEMKQSREHAAENKERKISVVPQVQSNNTTSNSGDQILHTMLNTPHETHKLKERNPEKLQDEFSST